MRTLDTFGFGLCTTRLADAVPAATVQLDYTTYNSRCHGYWLPDAGSDLQWGNI